MVRFVTDLRARAMASALDTFMNWWNRLALRNGKAKFRTEREAFEFIQHTYENSGGPNAEIRAMRKEYEEIRRARARREAGSNKGGDKPAVA